VWRGGAHKEAEILTSCYRNALAIAAKHKVKSIAFPSISTGIYGYPIELAAPTAIDAVYTFLSGAPELEEVLFCCFSDADLEVYQNALARVAA
jgi:O-acetyl-ADP-ribose deacetylase (regulator of RNase III)